MIDRLKLYLRARQYQRRRDQGGIAYILSQVKPGDIALDIGTHKAGYLYFMRKCVGTSGHVYAFEPQSTLFHAAQNLKSTLNWSNVTIEQIAMSDVRDTATLHIPINGRTSSTGASIEGPPVREAGTTSEEVNTDFLDGYCTRHLIKPAFIKIDVEGHELNVLQGGEQMLRSCKPRILVEIEARHVGKDRAMETFEFLRTLGFQGHFIQGARRVPLAEFDFQTHQNFSDKRNYCNNFTFA